MKKLFSTFVCALTVLLLSLSPNAFATRINTLDVGTISIDGVDTTKAIVGQATGTAFVHGVASVTGSSTFNPANIGTLSAVFVGLDTIVNDARYVVGTSSGQNIIASVYGIGAGTATAISTTETRVHYIAIGTP